MLCNLKVPSVTNCKQIREAMSAVIEQNNITVGMDKVPYVTEEKPAWLTFQRHAGAMEHCERIQTDMTNCLERLGMKWNEKRLVIVSRAYTDCRAGDTLEIFSERSRRYVWTVMEGVEAIATRLDTRGCSEARLWHRISKGNALFFAKKALLCDAKIHVKGRIHAFHASCVRSVQHGAGEWAYKQSMVQALRIWEVGKLRRVLCLRRRAERELGGVHEADRAHGCEAVAEAWSAARAHGGLADGAFPGRCKGPQVLGGVHHVAL